MRFSKSIRRGAVKTGWVWESTNPGRTTLPEQSISSACFASSCFVISVGRSDRSDLFAGNENSAVFDDGESRICVRGEVIAAAQGQQLGGVGEKDSCIVPTSKCRTILSD